MTEQESAQPISDYDFEHEAKRIIDAIEPRAGATMTLCSALREAFEAGRASSRDPLRVALVGLVGVDGREELEQMEVAMRLMPAPAADKAATIDAIHALIATLPQLQTWRG